MLRQCAYCGEFFERHDICPWCGSEGVDWVLDSDEWRSIRYGGRDKRRWKVVRLGVPLQG